jgi:hypothetical protein
MTENSCNIENRTEPVEKLQRVSVAGFPPFKRRGNYYAGLGTVCSLVRLMARDERHNSDKDPSAEDAVRREEVLEHFRSDPQPVSAYSDRN